MNSNSNFNNFDFDLGIGSNTRSSNSLNQHKNKSNTSTNTNNNTNSNSYSYSTSTTSYSQPKTTPSWTRTELGGPACLVGDIMGKNWNSTTVGPQKAAVTTSIGNVNKNPNLFGDLLNSALGQNKVSSNVPLKNVTPVKDSFSMGGMAGSLPNTSNASGSGNLGASVAWGSYQSSGSGTTGNGNANVNLSPGLGGPSLGGIGGVNSNKDSFGAFVDFSSKPMKDSVVGGSSGGGGTGMNSNKDPFGSFMDFSSNPMQDSVVGSSGRGGTGMNSNKDPFGSFLDFSSKPMEDSVVGSSGHDVTGMNSKKDPFGSFMDFSSKPVEDSVVGSSGHDVTGMNSNKDPFGSLVDFSSNLMEDSVVGSSGRGGTGMNSNKVPFGSFVDISSKPMKDSAVGGGGEGMNLNKDPFGPFVDFSSNTMRDSVVGGIPGIGVAGKTTASSEDFDFGDFQNASKSNPLPFSPEIGNPLESELDGLGSQNQSLPMHSTGADPFDMFLSVSASGGANAASDSGGGDDWGFDSGIGGHDDGGTTELDGLPPPPVGVSASTAKTKGLDNYKQGQFADAIKWLSWAEVLLKKAGETASTEEVLSCRASCYKEVGEYKKAVADCTKILDDDGTNVGVLVQRALLYESMEKYRLGAEDLRTVMKLDPGNRVARSTIHRLNKLAD